MVWVIPFCSPVAELNWLLGTQKLSGVDRSAWTRQVHTESPRIHLHTPLNPTVAVGDVTMSSWKPTISLIPPPPPPPPSPTFRDTQHPIFRGLVAPWSRLGEPHGWRLAPSWLWSYCQLFTLQRRKVKQLVGCGEHINDNRGVSLSPGFQSKQHQQLSHRVTGQRETSLDTDTHTGKNYNLTSFCGNMLVYNDTTVAHRVIMKYLNTCTLRIWGWQNIRLGKCVHIICRYQYHAYIRKQNQTHIYTSKSVTGVWGEEYPHIHNDNYPHTQVNLLSLLWVDRGTYDGT